MAARQPRADPRAAPTIETLARTVPDNGGVYFVPAFSGLYAPHWNDGARGTIVGLTRFANRGHLARAVARSDRLPDLGSAARRWNRTPVSSLETLRVDGGMTDDELLMQFQADIVNRGGGAAGDQGDHRARRRVRRGTRGGVFGRLDDSSDGVRAAGGSRTSRRRPSADASAMDEGCQQVRRLDVNMNDR